MSVDIPKWHTCFVCGEPVLDDEAHGCHEEGCPNYGLDWAGPYQLCDCDLWAHPECCPLCNPE